MPGLLFEISERHQAWNLNYTLKDMQVEPTDPGFGSPDITIATSEGKEVMLEGVLQTKKC